MKRYPAGVRGKARPRRTFPVLTNVESKTYFTLNNALIENPSIVVMRTR